MCLQHPSQAKRLRKENPEKNGELYASHEKLDMSFKPLIHRTLYRPFHMLLVEPMLQVVTLYVAIVYGLLYGRKSSFGVWLILC
jgi:DHA1 family multidrug resistance protein-like MFS transporter